MRVFCPQHQVAFLSPRRSPIRCENKGHILGELHLDEKFEHTPEILWQYCCNCEHFCPIDERDDQLRSCPVCKRAVSTLYLCDRCFTFSFESNNPTQTKNFTFTPDGAPFPSCPGCLRETIATLHEHDCDQLGKQFVTALNSCPICLARLDVGPVFPSSVADYVKRIKAANRLNVTFDYENGMFIGVDDGEFVLIRKTVDGGGSIVLPRAARFESRSDFYQLYQDYYHCNNFNAGEVQVIQPCCVEPLHHGWKLQSMGTLEVVNDLPRPKTQENIAHLERNVAVQEKRPIYMPLEKQKAPTRPCHDCGALVETRYAFCWKCGNPMTSDRRIATGAIETIRPSLEIALDYEDATVEHERRRIQPMFSWVAPEPKQAARSGMLRVIGILAAAFLLIPFGLFVLIRSASNSSSTTASQNAPPQAQREGSGGTSIKEKANVSTESTQQAHQLVTTAENELQKLRTERITAAASDRLQLIQSVLAMEKQYPSDYRFPYERAKLAINMAEKKSHEEAFSALSLAAEKAIKTNKSEEMLEGLEIDSTTDLDKLSHGHREWTQIIDALRDKDATLLVMR